MDRMQIFNEIALMLENTYGKCNVSENTMLSNGEDSLDLDSLEIVNLIIQIEKKFDIIIDFDVFFNTVGDLVSNVYEQLQETEISE